MVPNRKIRNGRLRRILLLLWAGSTLERLLPSMSNLSTCSTTSKLLVPVFQLLIVRLSTDATPLREAKPSITPIMSKDEEE